MKRVIYLILIILVIVVVFVIGTKKLAPQVYTELSEKFCSIRGGEMARQQCSMAGCTYKCMTPYRDAGKKCNNSEECSRKCVAIDNRLPTPFAAASGPEKADVKSIGECTKTDNNSYDCSALNLSGTCQERTLTNCEESWEFDNGVITPLSRGCSI